MSNPLAGPGTTARISRVVAGSAQDVFEAWTEPDKLRRWFGPEGTTVGLAEVDLRVGGRYRIRIEGEGGEQHTVGGTYREISPPQRLVFTWDWEEAEHRMGIETTVTVQLRPVENGTEVTITHTGFPAADAARGHDEGWASTLRALERYFA